VIKVLQDPKEEIWESKCGATRGLKIYVLLKSHMIVSGLRQFR